MPSIFPFVEKEGKYFAPIVSNEPRYRIAAEQVEATGRIQTRDGVWVEQDLTAPMTEKSGTKGTYAIVRMVLPTGPTTGGVSTPETLRLAFDVATCNPYAQVVDLIYTRVPDAEAAALRFTSIGYWRGTPQVRPDQITPASDVPVWTTVFNGENYYIFYINTDVTNTNGFAWGTLTNRVAHAGTGVITREITDLVIWTPDCDLINPNRTRGTITPGTSTSGMVTAGPAQEEGELFAVNTQSFLSSN